MTPPPLFLTNSNLQHTYFLLCIYIKRSKNYQPLYIELTFIVDQKNCKYVVSICKQNWKSEKNKTDRHFAPLMTQRCQTSQKMFAAESGTRKCNLLSFFCCCIWFCIRILLTLLFHLPHWNISFQAYDSHQKQNYIHTKPTKTTATLFWYHRKRPRVLSHRDLEMGN